MRTTRTPMLAAFAGAVTVTVHLHASFCPSFRVTTISTVGSAVRERSACKRSSSDQRRGAKDRRQAVSNAGV
jgi:hypothetical protein